ncbi:MAG: carboxypeptidase M32 [Planctomycetes bacterium]|nr:carboxypeptidase M32 [Planctomycetota bacterium]
MSDPVARLHALWGEIADLSHVSSLLSWDQETHMPRRGGAARAQLMATLAGVRHAKLVAPELGETVERCAERAEPGSALAAEVREARRILHRVTRLSERLARAKAEAAAQGHEAWAAARAARDFALFRPALERLVALAREEAGLLSRPGDAPYDVLLDEYEPGARAADVARWLGDLRRELAPLVAAAAHSARRPAARAASGSFPRAAQLAFARDVAERFGFDFERGRLDEAPHPFCSGFGPDDVRLTWRCDEHDFRPALFGILHEAGHGLYEQGLPAAWQRTPLGDAVSLGVHESQSRLWENMVGRSASFWRWALPRFQETCPGARALTHETLLPLLHSCEPSLIRVEADQGTYDLHVCVRFELERALFAGELEVAELPTAWDEAYAATLGLRAGDANAGVLQDIHWSMGAFGYFPTYTLGNLIAAQLFAAARRELGDLDLLFERGEFRPLLEWLREHVHRHGSFYSATELVERASGKPLSSADYLAQRRADAAEYYGV